MKRVFWEDELPGWCSGGNVGITGRIKIAGEQLYTLRFQTHLTTPIIVLALLASLVAAPVIILADGPVGEDPKVGSGKTDSKIGPLLQGALRGPEGTPGPGLKPEPQRQALGVGPDLGGGKGAETQGSEGFAASRTEDILGLLEDDPKLGGLEETAPEEPVRFDPSGAVQVYVHTTVTGEGERAALEESGVGIELFDEEEGIVQGWMPLSSLESVAGLEFVRRISAPDYAVPRTGTVNSQGDRISRAGVLRGISGLSGAGVKVGVISDGVDSRADAVATGDLPGELDIDPERSGTGDEGTALLEIVHDLAPGARLAFSGPGTSLEMVESIRWLADEAFGGTGSDIIVDDLGFFAEPYFEDGIVARAAQEAAAGGAVFVSSAGNSAKWHYDGIFAAGTGNYSAYHDFAAGGGDTALGITVRKGASVIILQWNDQFGNSGNDYDLYVCHRGFQPTPYNTNNGICLVSGGPQDGDDDPIEGVFIPLTDPNDQRTFAMDVFIHAYDNTANTGGRLKLFVLRGSVNEHGGAEGSIFGHPGVPDVIAVGAVDASDPLNDDIESFSSQGPAQVYFPTEVSRAKPDVVSIDGVAITGAGGFSNPFFGTSAASPHVAGIAALLLEADRKVHPGSHRQAAAKRISQHLKDTAVDLGDADFDNVFGAGRADALAAVAATGLLGAYTLTVNSTGDGGDSDTSDGVCDDGSGSCTLRAAIEEANAKGGAIIEFGIGGMSPYTIQPGSALPEVSEAVVIDGKSQIEIDGTNAGVGATGLTLSGPSGEVRGLAINRFGGDGVVIQTAGSKILADNLIGTDVTGTLDLGNGGAGVSITGSTGNALLGNIISGNASHGISISGTSAGNSMIAGNFIGTDATGAVDLGNEGAGVNIAGSPNIQVAGNIISGNASHGVGISGVGAADSEVVGNLIGADATGPVDLGNDGAGISISGASAGYVVGNLVHGNGTVGVTVSGAGATGNIIGLNTITENDSHGIQLDGAGASGSLVRLNIIGTDQGGTTDLGNGGSGVHIGGGASGNLVDKNTIAFSGGDGVTIVAAATVQNSVWENAIYSNTGLGIDLGDDGVTGNDSRDIDSGPNNLQNFPTLSAAAANGSQIGVHGSLNSEASTVYIVDFYSNSACDASGYSEGQVWLGYSVVQTDGNGDANISGYFAATGQAGRYITATATENYTLNGSTSEFSTCVQASTLPDLELPEGIEVYEGGTATYGVKLSEQPAGAVTVFLVSSTTSVATVAPVPPSGLVFLGTNWNSPQTVTVTGVGDDDTSDGSTSILHWAVNEGKDYFLGVVGVEVHDDDLPTLSLSPAVVTVTEGGSTTYTMTLAEEPTADVTVTFDTVSGDATAVGLSSSEHDFTTSNWNTGHTVTVNGVDDDDAVDQSLVLFHRATIGGKAHTLGRLPIIVEDDEDLPALTLSPDSVSVAEGGTATYTAALAAAPTGEVTVYLESLDPGAASVASDSITFTTSDWAGTEVTVTGVVDDDGLGEEAAIVHIVTIGGYSHLLGTVTVNVSDTDTAPYFVEGGTTTRSVPENATAGTDVGAPVTALDPDGGGLTYSLGSAGDEGHFDVDASSGHLSVAEGATLDFEAPGDADSDNKYEVTVSVTDSGGETDSIGVTVSVEDDLDGGLNKALPPERPTGFQSAVENGDPNSKVSLAWDAPDSEEEPEITDYDVRYRASGKTGWTEIDYTPIGSSGVILEDLEVGTTYQTQVRAVNGKGPGGWSRTRWGVTGTAANDPPFFGEGEAVSRSIEENSGTGANVGEPVGASDAESDVLTYSLSSLGTDHDSFVVDSTGQIRVAENAALDFEAQNLYTVTLSVHDGTDGDGIVDTTIDETIEVTITVTNAEELGTVALSSAQPQVGTGLTATLSDPDEGVTDEIWVWASSADGSTGWAEISGAVSEIYTPVAGNIGNYLRVTVSYDDGEGMGKSASAVSVNAVRDIPPVNTAPEFPSDETGLRSIAENAEAGAEVGDPVTATDADDGDTLTYNLSGTDSAFFAIGSADGQVRVAAGVSLDFESPADSGGGNDYEVTVTATDTSNATDTVDVTITVTDVDEPPDLSGPDSPTHPENSGAAVGAYTAADPEGLGISWSVEGDDGGDFSIGGGVLRFKTPPDFEGPADANGDNVYQVTVGAEDPAGNGAALAVSVEVTDVSDTVEPPKGGGGSGGGGGVGGAPPPTPLPNSAPVFSGGASAVFSVPENTPAGENVGTSLGAQDADGDALTYTLSGADAGAFAVDAASGQLRTGSPLDYEAKSSYTVIVAVSDGRGGRDSIVVTIVVTDVDETVAPMLVPAPIDNPLTQVVETVEPQTETVVVTEQRTAIVTFPAGSRETAYQVRVDSSIGNCAANAPGGDLQGCLTVDIFDSQGNRERGVVLDQPATLQITLDAEELGGAEVVLAAHERGGVRVYTREEGGAQWREVPFTMEPSSKGDITITVTGVTSFSEFAVETDPVVFAQVEQPDGPETAPTPVAPSPPEPIPEPRQGPEPETPAQPVPINGATARAQQPVVVPIPEGARAPVPETPPLAAVEEPDSELFSVATPAPAVEGPDSEPLSVATPAAAAGPAAGPVENAAEEGGPAEVGGFPAGGYVLLAAGAGAVVLLGIWALVRRRKGAA